jgi:hypothetical protein
MQQVRKMNMNSINEYLISPEFKSRLHVVVEGFLQKKIGLKAGKLNRSRPRSIREKQMEKVVLNTTAMYGAIRGIGGKTISKLQVFEIESRMRTKNY